MTRVEIVIVAVRVGALWLFLQSLLFLLSLFGVVLSLSAGSTVPVEAALLSGLMMVLAALLWHFSPALATRLLPSPDPDTPVMPLVRQDLESIAFRLVGLVLSASAISILIGMLISGVYRAETFGGSAAEAFADGRGRGVLIQHLVQLAIGLALLFEKTGLVKTPAPADDLEEESEDSPAVDLEETDASGSEADPTT